MREIKLQCTNKRYMYRAKINKVNGVSISPRGMQKYTSKSIEAIKYINLKKRPRVNWSASIGVRFIGSGFERV